MTNQGHAAYNRSYEARPDVNDPNTVDRLTRDAIRILLDQSESNRRHKRRR